MKQIIILEKLKRDGNVTELRYIYWAAVPAARQAFYAQPAEWDSAWPGRSVQEIADLRAGAMTEKVFTATWAPLPGETTPQFNARIRDELVDGWGKFNTQIQNFNAWDRYGSFYELPNGWTAAGVA